MDISKTATFFLLLLIASGVYTTNDKLVIYGFVILTLITVGLGGLFFINYKNIVEGYSKSGFGKYIIVDTHAWLNTGFWISLVVMFGLSLKMIIQVVLQLSRRANKLKSIDLNLSKESLRLLGFFRNTYYVFIVGLPILLFSFSNNDMLHAYPRIKWVQFTLYITLWIVFFIFADMFIKGEFVKIKNESTTPLKTTSSLTDETKKEKQQRIEDTSVIHR